MISTTVLETCRGI